MAVDRPRVLLLWPGGLFAGGANFGVPQLVGMATFLERNTSARVDVVDLDMEQAFGPVRLDEMVRGGYDVVGISCYSSYDYLKVCVIAERVKQLLPKAWICVGGYHPSARPGDFLRDGLAFDFVAVGDGEYPLRQLVEAIESGKRPLDRTLGPASVADVGEVAPYDWSKLEKYRPIARSRASQAEIYLSRGCPYDCSFCMERAKRDTSWRSLSAEAAVEEMHRFDSFVDLSGWTLFIADALFGMKRSWRRQFLEALARRPVRSVRTWLLIRLDLIERDDFELMARANVSPGFGLESGDESQLRRIRKTGKLDGYLDKMFEVAEWARELRVPFGANVIVGHPGETEATLRTSAEYLRRLFLDARGSYGFLSVDPFRLYPGSPIEQDFDRWQSETGVRVHRFPWWEDGDQDFLAEWVDPSAELDFRSALKLQHELFSPTLRELVNNFAYTGPGRDYFMRAVNEQVQLASDQRRLDKLAKWHLWSDLTAGADEGHSKRISIAEDEELAGLARSVRGRTLKEIGVDLASDLGRALLATPRERFVADPSTLVEAQLDRAVALSWARDGTLAATISALHSYHRVYRALDLGPGDHFADLGGGTGYGSAVAARLVGATGSVHCVEIDADLCAHAERELASYAVPWRVSVRDAHRSGVWRGATKVSVGFALERAVVERWAGELPVGGRIVAPVTQSEGAQLLLLLTRTADGTTVDELGSVSFVGDRGRGGDMGTGVPASQTAVSATIA